MLSDSVTVRRISCSKACPISSCSKYLPAIFPPFASNVAIPGVAITPLGDHLVAINIVCVAYGMQYFYILLDDSPNVRWMAICGAATAPGREPVESEKAQ